MTVVTLTLSARCRFWIVASVLLAAVSTHPLHLQGQGREPDNYIRFLPLTYPRLVRQTDASQRFALFGDSMAAGYRDADPVDGIDDRRHGMLHALARRFAPHMVQNTFSVPMNFKEFTNGRAAFPMYVDTWEMAGGGELVRRETVDFTTLGRTACPEMDATNGESRRPDTDDCRVLALLDEFDPDRPTNEWNLGVDPDRNLFKVMYFDMPGWDETSWREEYVNQFSNQTRAEYRDFARVYAHPFIHEVRNNTDGLLGYEFVIQYWFYYPMNDGGNNHEGDWEHLNVVVTPIDRATDRLSAQDLQRILDRRTPAEQLVIKRVEYFFHHKVMILDYTKPNVYQDRESWTHDVDRLTEERIGQRGIWKEIRRRAYQDKDETEINTHPVAYIGADNKGLDQLFAMPGSRNQDSHGTFPFPGLFKDVGPQGSAEQIPQSYDHRKYFADTSRWLDENNRSMRGGHVELFDDPGSVEIVPDWEHILPQVRRSPSARREWAWMVLPVRWGYPATASPLAGLVEHADMGNLGPVGPAYNAGWNRVGASVGFDLYEPHRLSSFLPTAVQDGYQNNLGWLNGTVPTWVNLPPFDFLWRIVAAPFRAIFKRQHPIYFPNETVPFRFFGFSGGTTYQFLPDDFFRVLFQADIADAKEYEELVKAGIVPPDTITLEQLSGHIAEISDMVTAIDTLGFDDPRLVVQPVTEAAIGSITRFSFHLGNHFSSENTVRNVRATVGLDFALFTRPDLFRIRSELNLWEWAGSLRWNVATDRVQPFVKVGYGYSWYRLEDMVADGQPLENDTTPWAGSSSLIPNTLHLGTGIEFIPIQSFAKFPGGIDIGIRGEVEWFTHKLGLNEFGEFLAEDVLLEAGLVKRKPRISRTTLNLGLTVSF